MDILCGQIFYKAEMCVHRSLDQQPALGDPLNGGQTKAFSQLPSLLSLLGRDDYC